VVKNPNKKDLTIDESPFIPFMQDETALKTAMIPYIEVYRARRRNQYQLKNIGKVFVHRGTCGGYRFLRGHLSV